MFDWVRRYLKLVTDRRRTVISRSREFKFIRYRFPHSYRRRDSESGIGWWVWVWVRHGGRTHVREMGPSEFGVRRRDSESRIRMERGTRWWRRRERKIWVWKPINFIPIFKTHVLYGS